MGVLVTRTAPRKGAIFSARTERALIYHHEEGVQGEDRVKNLLESWGLGYIRNMELRPQVLWEHPENEEVSLQLRF